MSEYISERDLSSIEETSMAAYAGLTVTDGGICLQRTELPQTITQAGALDTEATEDKTDNRFGENNSSSVESSDKKLSTYELIKADILSRASESIDNVIKDPVAFDRLFEEWSSKGGGAFPLVPGLSDATDRLIESISKMVKDSQNLENSDVPERTSSDIVLEVKSDVLLQSVEDFESENSDSKVDSSDKNLSTHELIKADILSRTSESIDNVIKDPVAFDRLFEEWSSKGGGAFPLVPGLSDATDRLIESISKKLLILGSNKTSSTAINIDEGTNKDSFNDSDISSDQIQENHNRTIYYTINTPSSFFDVSSQDTALYGTKGFVGGISNMSWADFESSTSSNYWNARVFLSSDGKRVIDAEKCSSNPNDTLKCWAAADANMLFRTGWFTSETTTEDKVFDCFRKEFSLGNQYGGHQFLGAEWYLTGVYPPLSSGQTGIDMCSSGTGGYFSSSVSESFFSSSCMAYDLIGYGDYFCKKAFVDLSYGRSVSLSITDSANPDLGHALTLHGITYNFTPETETTSAYYEIKSILVSDSDDDRNNSNPEEAYNVLKVIPVSIQNGNLVLNPDYYYPTNGSHTIDDYTVLYPADFASLLYVDPGLSFISLEQYGATLLNQHVMIDERLVVSSAGLAMNTTVFSGGTQNVFADGTALNTILSSGGVMNVFSGGSTSFVQIQSGGSMIVSSGAIVSGEVKLGGTMIVSGGANGSGAMINYQVKDRTTSDGAMLTNPGYLTSASFAATVSGNEAFDSYQLANGVPANYSGASFAMYKGSDLIGTLSVGSGKLSTSYRLYSLKAENNILSMDVTEKPIKSDIDDNRISDVMMIHRTRIVTNDQKKDYISIGFWKNGTNTWQGTGINHPINDGNDPNDPNDSNYFNDPDKHKWIALGAYDMNANGKADAVLVGDIVMPVGGADLRMYAVGYYIDSNDDDSNWMNISYLGNPDDYVWKNKVGNLTGNAGMNSIVWYSPELYSLGAWTDGTDNWTTMSNGFGGDDWTLVGCGDFDGDGRDSVIMSYKNGESYWYANLDGTTGSMGTANWSGQTVGAVGDFSGDGRDDIILFYEQSGTVTVTKLVNGNADNSESLGQLTGIKIVGCGDYDGDGKDDLLVKQNSTATLGYYSEGILDANHKVNIGTFASGWNVIA